MKNQKQIIKNILKEEILNFLKEDVNYNFDFKGKKFKVRFDVNANPTKKGVKIQFQPLENLASDPNEARQLINELQIFLNQKLGNIGMTVDFDADVPYNNVIGFTLKLGTLANMLMKAIGGDTEVQDPKQVQQPGAQQQPNIKLKTNAK